MTVDESEALMYMRSCSERGCKREMFCMSISMYHFPQHDSGVSTFAMRHDVTLIPMIVKCNLEHSCKVCLF